MATPSSRNKPKSTFSVDFGDQLNHPSKPIKLSTKQTARKDKSFPLTEYNLMKIPAADYVETASGQPLKHDRQNVLMHNNNCYDNSFRNPPKPKTPLKITF
jgi:hypothetical protein